MSIKQSFVVVAILSCMFASLKEARAAFFTVDANGQQVAIVPKETPYDRYKDLKTFEAFQFLDDTDRQYALRDTLYEAMDPNAKLTANQKIGVRHVLAQYYDTIPGPAKEELQRKVLWMSLVGGQSELTVKMADKFFSADPANRAKRLCTLVSDSTQMILYGKEKPTFDYFAKLGPETLTTLANLIDSEKQLTNDKCPLGEGDPAPLSLKEMRTKITKLIGPTTPTLTAPTVITASKPTQCTLRGVETIFNDAVTKIERNGANTRVYLGVNTMNCPVYGLVMRDSKTMYRYYQNTYREEGVPTLRFKTASEVTKLFQPVAALPAAKPGTARPTTR